MPLSRTGRRRSPYALERSEIYLERVRTNNDLAAQSKLPHVREKHLEVAARWMDFARRAQAVEAGGPDMD